MGAVQLHGNTDGMAAFAFSTNAKPAPTANPKMTERPIATPRQLANTRRQSPLYGDRPPAFTDIILTLVSSRES